MSKIITIPSSIDEINKTKDLVDGFIIGIDNMCVNSNLCIDDLSILRSLKDKEIFINLNKNMHNEDLKVLENILLDLNDYNIKGVLFYDIGVLNIYKRLDLNYDLVMSQEHALTNLQTINYWDNEGVNYSYVSSDITMDEIKKIIDGTKSKVMVTLFGYLPMFVSKRHIVKNYLNNFKLDDNSKTNYIEKEDNIYPIIDNNIGTCVYSSNILNGIKYSLNGINYIVLNSLDIEMNKFIDVIKLFKSVDENNINDYERRINNMFANVDYGFLERKTIYKVGHEKA